MLAKTWSPALLGCALALATGACSLLNKLDVCGDSSREFRVNQRADGDEYTAQPASAVAFGDNRLLVSYTATTTDASNNTASEARIAILELTTGTRLALCEVDGVEKVLNANGTYADTTTAAPVFFQQAVAAVGWTESSSTGPIVRMVYVDDKGCPLNPGVFQPGVGMTSVRELALGWSNARQMLLTAYHDGQKLYGTWLSQPESSAVVTLDQQPLIGDGALPSIAASADGHMLIVYPASTIAEAVNNQGHIRAVLLAPDGSVQRAFNLDFPSSYSATADEFSAAAAGGVDRFAVALSGATSTTSQPQIAIEELDLSGNVLIAPRLLDADGSDQKAPALSFAPDGSLVAAWESTQHSGTMARLFDSQLSPRFNGQSCDDSAFPVGTRTRDPVNGYPALTWHGADLVIAHPAEPPWDSNADGTLAWTAPFNKLWPAK